MNTEQVIWYNYYCKLDLDATDGDPYYDILRWCNEHFGNAWKSDVVRRRVWFRYEEDATAYKLRWG